MQDPKMTDREHGVLQGWKMFNIAGMIGKGPVHSISQISVSSFNLPPLISFLANLYHI